MKVDLLLVDYDGTVAPLGVPRDESRIFRSVEKVLREISLKIPVCIVTAKDFDFVEPRSGFAAAWACVSGLDVRLADGRRFTRKKVRSLQDEVELAKWSEGMGSFTELKHGPSGELLGVGIDWSGAPEAGMHILRKIKPLIKAGSPVVYDRQSTFADFYAAPPDKGRATKLLKKVLGKRSGAMFIGDSANDNGAFQEAEMAIGIAHGQPMSQLRCGYVVEQKMLAGFLGSLQDRGMDFTPSLPAVRAKGGR